MATPTWRIEVRDANLNRVGEIANFVDLTLLLKFNDVGQFSLTVPYGGNSAAVESALAQPGCGLIISRDYGNGTMTPLLSGPVWDNARRLRDDTRVLDGWGDLFWLKAREVKPAGGRVYYAQVNLLSPLRYCRLGESSGTVAFDLSANSQNGTISGTVAYNAGGSVSGDPDGAMTFTAANNAYISLPMTGLPSGNGAWSWAFAVKFASNPASNQTIVCLGTNATGGWAAVDLLTTGAVAIDGNAFGTLTSGTLSTGAWHLVVATWDGTTATLQVDGGTPVTNTPGARSVGTTGCYIGAGVGTSGARINQFGGTLDEVALFGYALSSTQRAALYAAWAATHGATDSRSGKASTVILGYVGANLTSPTNADRQMASVALAGDPAVGSTVTFDGREQNLLAVCQWLAAAGGDIGFKAIQSSGTQITFTVYQPQLASNALFSTELGNLLDAEYKVSGPTGNAVTVGGPGTGAGRSFYETTDATSVAQYGRVETFRDERGAVGTPTLATTGADELTRDKLLTNLSATPLDTPACAFQKDYNLGDKASVVIDGAQIQDIVRQVAITLDAQGNETVTPAIGNPGSGQVGQHDGTDLTDTTVRRLVKLETRLAKLEAAQ